jgi:hypothetical protein
MRVRLRVIQTYTGSTATCWGKIWEKIPQVFEDRRNHCRMKALPRIEQGLLRLGTGAGSVPDIHCVHEHPFPRAMKFKNRRHAVRLCGDEDSTEGSLHHGRRRCARAPPSGLVLCHWNEGLNTRVSPTRALACMRGRDCARNTCADELSAHGLRYQQWSKSSDVRRRAPQNRTLNATIVSLCAHPS